MQVVGLLVIFTTWFLWPVSEDFLDVPFSTVVNDSSGELLSASIAADEQWRLPVIDQVPERFAKAIITYEDKRFYTHPGVDPLALARAIKQNAKAKRIVSGASTISMQVGRIISGYQNRSLWQKVKELRTALRLEVWHSKEDILRWYSSLAPYGGNVVGLQAACWRYYHKSPDQLSWAEAATLAVLPNAPSLIHVNRNRHLLQSKRDHLLRLLYKEGHLDEIDLEASYEEPLPSKLYALPQKAPHLLQLVKQRPDIRDKIDIDPALQASIAEVMHHLHGDWQQNEISNAGCIVLDTKTGQVIAYHGNIKGTIEADVDMIQARRSSGSILKPFLYAHMMDKQMITPEQIVLDIPTYIAGFSPSNYNKNYSGAISASEALQRSLNVPYVRMLKRYGISPFLDHLRDHGLSSLDRTADNYGLSLVLGGGEVRLWDLAYAYRDLGASLIHNEEVAGLSPSVVYQTLDALKGLNRPDEEGDWQRMDSRAPIAWKTGTSYGHRDAWGIGVHPEITIAVWVGNADGEGRDGIIGTKTAGRLLFAVAGRASLGMRWFDEPLTDMAYLRKCHHSGMLASTSCPQVDTVFWPVTTEQADVCSYHEVHIVSKDRSWRFDGYCDEVSESELHPYFDLPASAAHYYKRSHPDWSPLPPVHPDCDQAKATDEMDIIYPTPNEYVYLPKDLNEEQQSLVVRVAHARQDATLYWYMDDRYFGETRDFHSYGFLPEAGDHIITIVDDTGYQLSRKVTVTRG